LRSARLSTISFKNSTKTPKHLEILGDGKQTKSYLYISDCIEAILFSLEKTKNQIEIYNIGSEDQIDVKTIAEIVVEKMGLKGIEFKFAGGVDGGRGWKGDAKNMFLDITKLKSHGWKPKHNTKQAITKATQPF
jgi:UDP-glucose 4-epimerase